MKEPCPNCKESVDVCACIRNKCVKCGEPVGNITFSLCDKCWDVETPKTFTEKVSQPEPEESQEELFSLVYRIMDQGGKPEDRFTIQRKKQ